MSGTLVIEAVKEEQPPLKPASAYSLNVVGQKVCAAVRAFFTAIGTWLSTVFTTCFPCLRGRANPAAAAADPAAAEPAAAGALDVSTDAGAAAGPAAAAPAAGASDASTMEGPKNPSPPPPPAPGSGKGAEKKPRRGPPDTEGGGGIKRGRVNLPSPGAASCIPGPDSARQAPPASTGAAGPAFPPNAYPRPPSPSPGAAAAQAPSPASFSINGLGEACEEQLVELLYACTYKKTKEVAGMVSKALTQSSLQKENIHVLSLLYFLITSERLYLTDTQYPMMIFYLLNRPGIDKKIQRLLHYALAQLVQCARVNGTLEKEIPLFLEALKEKGMILDKDGAELRSLLLCVCPHTCEQGRITFGNTEGIVVQGQKLFNYFFTQSFLMESSKKQDLPFGLRNQETTYPRSLAFKFGDQKQGF